MAHHETSLAQVGSKEKDAHNEVGGQICRHDAFARGPGEVQECKVHGTGSVSTEIASLLILCRGDAGVKIDGA